MKVQQTWQIIRPIALTALSITVFATAINEIPRLPGFGSGKFLSDVGFKFFGLTTLLSLCAIGTILRARWWDFTPSLVLALWIIRFDFSEYWTQRLFPSVIGPIVVAATLGLLMSRWRQSQQKKCPGKGND